MYYTRAGDNGTTATCNISAGRMPKSSLLIEALGNVDELNALLGLCRSKLRNKKLRIIVEEAQQNLFIIQAEIAGADMEMPDKRVEKLEEAISGVEKKLPKITTFLLSGGTEISAYFGLARAVARRAERRVFDAVKNGELSVSEATLAYLNRLSSLLYVIERLINKQAKIKEKPPRYK